MLPTIKSFHLNFVICKCDAMCMTKQKLLDGHWAKNEWAQQQKNKNETTIFEQVENSRGSKLTIKIIRPLYFLLTKEKRLEVERIKNLRDLVKPRKLQNQKEKKTV